MVELRGIQAAGRTGGTAPARTAGVAETAAAERPRTVSNDRVELSRAAMDWVETLNDQRFQAQERAAALAQKKNDSLGLLDQLKSADESADAQSEALEAMSRCMKIASNLMKGKRVPPRDLKYLMEHEPKLYQMAMSLRRPSKDDEDSDPVITDEIAEEEAARTAESMAASGGGESGAAAE